MNLPHDSRPQHVKPFGYPKTVSALSDLPSDQSVVPSYSTTPRVVFRPSTTILSARPTPTIERSLSNRHLYLPYHPENPPVRGCAKCHNRIYAGPGGLLGGGRASGQTPAGPMSPGVLFRFSEFRKFSPTPLPSVAIPPASNESSPRQPAPTRQTLRLSINDVSALSDLPSDQSVVPTHSTTPRVVFRPPTAILRAGRTPANCHPTPSAGFRASHRHPATSRRRQSTTTIVGVS